MEFLLTVANEATKELTEERLQILPWFMGFFVAIFLSNLIIGKMVRKDKAKKEDEEDKEDKEI